MKPRPLLHRLRGYRRPLLLWLRRPGMLGVLTGGALLTAFPPLEWTLLPWVALAPLLAVLGQEGDPAQRQGLWAWFGAGWGLGLVLHAGNYQWMMRAMLEIAGVPPWQFIPFWLLMVGTFALGPAAVLGACAWARSRWSWGLWWTAPLGFLVLDALLLRFPFGGMPWGSLAATQPETVAAAWLAPVLGGPGVVGAIVALNTGWALLLGGSGRRGGWPALGAAGLALLLALLVSPSTPDAAAPGEGRTLRALLVPSDLPVPTPQESTARLRHYVGKTLAAAGPAISGHRAATPRLVVWPESASAGDLSRGKALVELHELATLVEGDIVLGSDTRDQGRDYNSLYLVRSGAFDFQRYDKRRLVPFGEYVPTPFRAAFGRKATRGEQDYTAGGQPPVLRWGDHVLGLAICFESTIPGHIAEAVRHGAQVLVVIANDAWLTAPAQTHHLRLTQLRALEADRDALFVANGGWSARISGGHAVRAAAAADAPLLVEARVHSSVTPWVTWGTLLPYVLALAALGARLGAYGVAWLLRPQAPRLPLR